MGAALFEGDSRLIAGPHLGYTRGVFMWLRGFRAVKLGGSLTNQNDIRFECHSALGKSESTTALKA